MIEDINFSITIFDFATRKLIAKSRSHDKSKAGLAAF